MSDGAHTGLSLATLAAATRGFAEAELCDLYAPAFLMRQMGQGTAAAGPSDVTLLGLPAKERNPSAGVSLIDYTVYLLRRAQQKRFGGDYIAIGRGDNNDVLIDDASVSKFHAFIVQDEALYALADAGSRFGTFLNDQKVPMYRDAKPLPLKEGDRVRLGEVRLTFMPAAAILALCRRV
jgi:hypothetical protein